MFYVYVDRRKDDQEPFYVGRGRLNRVNDYKRRNRAWRMIVAKHGVVREIVLTTEDESSAIDEEVKLIFKLKTRDYFGGANLTDGGLKHTKSVKEVLSALSRNRMRTPKERMSASKKFKRMWDENRDKIMSSHVKGSQHGKTSLTDEEVIRLREEFDALDLTERGSTSEFCESWASALHITQENVYKIVKRKSWTHLP